jgi:hypothetical protein
MKQVGQNHPVAFLPDGQALVIGKQVWANVKGSAEAIPPWTTSPP